MSSESLKLKFLEKAEIKLGIGLTPDTKKSVARANESYAKADEALLSAHITDLALYSDACTSEIEFVQGIVDKDPHPNHAVIFSSKASDASRLL